LYHKVIHAPLLKKQKNNTVKLYEPILKEHFEIIIKKYVEDKIKQALTPPTADEVCKALSDYYGKEVKVDKRYNNTTFVCDGRNIAWVDNNGSVQINQPKPPHLITLIGRFYAGLEND
jgi:hypothetical protein